jgi:hypothetical protein
MEEMMVSNEESDARWRRAVRIAAMIHVLAGVMEYSQGR